MNKDEEDNEGKKGTKDTFNISSDDLSVQCPGQRGQWYTLMVSELNGIGNSKCCGLIYAACCLQNTILLLLAHFT